MQRFEQERELDELCDRFESDLKSNSAGGIADYLQTYSGDPTQAFAELLTLELEYQQEPVGKEFYSNRFPDFIPQIDEAFDSVSWANRNSGATRFAELAQGEFGQYQVMREIGRGGMGIVYLVTQPLADRNVALKIIKPDLASGRNTQELKDLSRRFRLEAKSSAQLQHPNIVPIYDVGESKQGPYFTMEYVQGPSLRERLSESPLEPKQAAKYAMQIAEAVDYAHGRGIIHRDLKPGNVLLSNGDCPMIVDFGMAKWLGSESLTMTEFGLGTPAYMSPEQINNGEVDKATDVYGIGATLYAMTTGRPPFQAADPLATMRQVVDNEPVNPKRINDDIPLDLETICLKCLQKDPRNRYGNAVELASELNRFLTGRPILARPVGRTERLWRWSLRNPIPATLSAALIAAVLIGSILVFWQWRVAVENAKFAAVQQKLAKADFERAQKAVDDYFTIISQEKLLDEPGMEPLRKQLLASAVSYYEEFIEQHEDDRELRHEFALAQHRLAMIRKDLDELGLAQSGAESAITILQELLKANPANVQYRRDLASAYSNLSSIQSKSGNDSGAIESAQASLNQAEILVDAGANVSTIFVSNVMLKLASLYNETGSFERAREIYQAIVTSIETDDLNSLSVDSRSVLADVYRGLGYHSQVTGDLAESLQQYETALGHAKSVWNQFPDKWYHAFDVSDGYVSLSTLQILMGKNDDALASAQTSIDTLQPFVTNNPANTQLKAMFANCHSALGSAQRAKGDWENALAEFERVAEISFDVWQKDTENVESKAVLANAYQDCGNSCLYLTQYQEAIVWYEKSLALKEELAIQAPENSEHEIRLVTTQGNLGEAMLRAGDYEQADKYLNMALEGQQKLVERFPDQPEKKMHLATLVGRWGLLYKATDKPEAAQEWLEQAVDMLNDLAAANPKDAKINVKKRNMIWYLALLLEQQEKFEEASVRWDETLATKPSASQTNVFRLARARSLALSGKQLDALNIARSMLANENLDQFGRYCVARVFAIVARDELDGPAAEKIDQGSLSEEAIAILDELSREGHFKYPRSQTDLRTDKDFAELLEKDEIERLITVSESVADQ